MPQKEFRLYLAAGIAIVIVGLACFYALLEDATSARTSQSICVQTSVAKSSVCYGPATRLSGGQTTTIATAPTGQLLASGERHAIQLWNLETGRLERSLTGHTNWISALAFSPDGRLLASSSLDGTIKLWNVRTGAIVTTLKSGRVTCLKFSPDGQFLASGSRIQRWADGPTSHTGVQLWNVATGAIAQQLGTRPVTALAFSPSGQLLAAGSTNTQVWQIGTRKLLHILDSGELTSLAFQSDQILITGSSRLKFWDPRSGALQQLVKSSAADLALSSTETVLVTAAGGTLNVWQLSPRRLVGTLRGSSYSGISVEFSPDDQTIVSSGSDGIQLWRSRPYGSSAWSRSRK